METTTLVQLRRIGLHPSPDTTSVNRESSFSEQFRDMLVGEQVVQISTYGRDDHFAGVLAAFERVRGSDRQRFLPYQSLTSKPRNGTYGRFLNGFSDLSGIAFYGSRPSFLNFATESFVTLSICQDRDSLFKLVLTPGAGEIFSHKSCFVTVYS